MKSRGVLLWIEKEKVLPGTVPAQSLTPPSPSQERGRFFRTGKKVLSMILLAGLFWGGFGQEIWAKVPPEWTLLGNLPGDRLITEYFRIETKKISDLCLTNVTTLDQWKSCREEYHRQFREMLGLDPMPARTDLKPVITGQIEAEDFVVEKLYFQSLPRLYVTGNLYRPKEVREPLPGILYVCGHGGVKKGNISFGNKCSYQHHGVWFARHGYVCLVIDSIQLGEIEGIHHGTYQYGMWWWNSYGYTPAGVEAWNCVRALDYLQSRKDVDPKRLGVTGRSGGGAYSWWIAALDERVQAAVPVAGITDLQNHVVDGCVEGHCDCMYMVNTYRWDYPLVAALIAPRPLLLGNTDDDNIFPLDGIERFFVKVQHIYALYGAKEKFAKAIFPGGHQDLPELQKAAFAFFDQQLKGIQRDSGEVGIKPFQPEQLKVFQQLPADQINTTIQERFVQLAPPGQPPESKADWDKQVSMWMELLRAKTFRAWPDRPPEPQVKPLWRAEAGAYRLQAYEFTSQEAVRLPLFVLQRMGEKPAGSHTGSPAPGVGTSSQEALFLLLSDQAQWDCFVRRLPESLARRLILPEPSKPEKEAEKKTPAAKKSDHPSKPVETLPPETWESAWSAVEAGKVLVVFAPRGVGLTAFNPTQKKQTQIRRRFMLLGQTLEGVQLWDVRRAIQVARGLPELQSARWQWMGRQDGAGMILYGALFEPGPDRMVLYEPPASHRDGLPLLNVRRIWDVPEALAVVATRTKVRLHTSQPEMARLGQEVLRRLDLGTERLEVVPVREGSSKP